MRLLTKNVRFRFRPMLLSASCNFRKPLYFKAETSLAGSRHPINTLENHPSKLPISPIVTVCYDFFVPVYWTPLASQKLERKQLVAKFDGFNDHGNGACDGKVLARAAWGESMIT